ncbi:D-alanyl-D-alanine carboxypeptidase family protein [Candidatus Kaiserbacteria bacterium]|nr:D-alanyl-D-alanine carboxypeptidase family protein [Candidatus Kaiserbacteria bacterium]
MYARSITVFVLVSFVWISYVSAQTLSPGCHVITPEEIAGLKASGVAEAETVLKSGQFCDKDKPLLNGNCPESPYPYLQTKNKTGRPDSVSGLNSDFACRAYKFTKAAEAAGQDITIGSGYRSVDLQKKLYAEYEAKGKAGAPVAPPGRSKHNFGLAIDFRYSGQHSNFGAGQRNTEICIQRLSACKWAHANAAQFGLRYPMLVEPWHIEPSGNVSGTQQPQIPSGGWLSDDTGTPYQNPSPFGNPLTSFMQPQLAAPPLQPSVPTSQTLIPAQPVTSQPIPSATPSSVPVSTSAINPSQIDTVLPTPRPISDLLSKLPTSTPISTKATSTKATSTPQSAFDIISLIAGEQSNPSASIDTSKSIPVTLNTNLGDITRDDSTRQHPLPDTTGPLPTSITGGQIALQQTFATPDFGGTSIAGSIFQNQSLYISMLTTFRDALLSIRDFLKYKAYIPTPGSPQPWTYMRDNK